MTTPDAALDDRTEADDTRTITVDQFVARPPPRSGGRSPSPTCSPGGGPPATSPPSSATGSRSTWARGARRRARCSRSSSPSGSSTRSPSGGRSRMDPRRGGRRHPRPARARGLRPRRPPAPSRLRDDGPRLARRRPPAPGRGGRDTLSPRGERSLGDAVGHRQHLGPDRLQPDRGGRQPRGDPLHDAPLPDGLFVQPRAVGQPARPGVEDRRGPGRRVRRGPRA